MFMSEKKNQLTVKTVPFMGSELMAVKDEKTGKIYDGVSYICKGIGLTDGQATNERRRISHDIVLNRGYANLHIPTESGEQDVQCIDNEFIPLWLAKITITPNMQKEQPEVADKLVQYQLKAQKVLADAFLHKNSNVSDLEELKAETAKERASAMSLNARTRAFKAIMSTFDGSKYSPVAAEVFGLTALETVTGQKIDYRPDFEKSWTATDIFKETGICASTVGKIATAAGLKTDTYGKAILNHVPGQSKQVPEFHYNADGHKLLLEACDKWKASHAKKQHQKSKNSGKAA
jgi:hypothetical protein